MIKCMNHIMNTRLLKTVILSNTDSEYKLETIVDEILEQTVIRTEPYMKYL